jgi:hypothetical protein
MSLNVMIASRPGGDDSESTEGQRTLSNWLTLATVAAMVANGLYDKLDALRLLYGSEFVEEVLDGIIDRKRRLNRLVELKSKVIVTVDEQDEIRFLERLFKRYVYNLARENAEARQFLPRTRWPTSASRI